MTITMNKKTPRSVDGRSPPPKPHPTTSMPDRAQPNQRSDYDQMKAGISPGKLDVLSKR